MKFGNIFLSTWLLVHVRGAEHNDLPQDNEDFWHRFVLHEEGSLPTPRPSGSIKTPRPTPQPFVTLSPVAPVAPIAPIAPVIPPVAAPVLPPAPVPAPTPQSPRPSLPPQQTTPPAGGPPQACLVDVEVVCTTTPTEAFPEGRPCDEIIEPARLCSGGGPIEAIQFSYLPAECAVGSNNQGANAACEDVAAFPDATETVVIECVDTATGVTLNVQPVVVGEGNIFTVTNSAGGALPASIRCTISDEDGSVIQTNVFDVSGSVELKLKDRFGGMTLDACDESSCLETITYTYDINNEGTEEMRVNVVDRSFTAGGTVLDVDLVNLVSPNPMQPGQTVSIDDTFTIDICRPGTYEVDVGINATSPDGLICFAEDAYDFSVGTAPVPTAPVSAPTPRPSSGLTPRPTLPPSTSPGGECALDFSIECEVDGVDCTSIPSVVDLCTDRPYAMTMQLNGGDCSQSYSVQIFQPDKFSCTDVAAGGVPATEGTEVFVVVTALNDPSIIYTYESVPVGETFSVNNGNQRFESSQNVTIYSSDQVGYDTMLQTIKYDSSCSQNLFLNDRFGAVQVVEWTNEAQGVVSSSANATFDVSVTVPEDIAGSSLTVTSFFAVTNFGVFNFTDEVFGATLTPGAVVEVTFDVTLDLAEARRYTILAEIAAVTDTGDLCTGTAFYNFTAGAELPPSLPSDAPAVSPGGSKTSKNKNKDSTDGGAGGEEPAIGDETGTTSKGGTKPKNSDSESPSVGGDESGTTSKGGASVDSGTGTTSKGGTSSVDSGTGTTSKGATSTDSGKTSKGSS